jgi:hypothetical protein
VVEQVNKIKVLVMIQDNPVVQAVVEQVEIQQLHLTLM